MGKWSYATVCTYTLDCYSLDRHCDCGCGKGGCAVVVGILVNDLDCLEMFNGCECWQ